MYHLSYFVLLLCDVMWVQSSSSNSIPQNPHHLGAGGSGIGGGAVSRNSGCGSEISAFAAARKFGHFRAGPEMPVPLQDISESSMANAMGMPSSMSGAPWNSSGAGHSPQYHPMQAASNSSSSASHHLPNNLYANRLSIDLANRGSEANHVSQSQQSAMANAVSEHGANNFATIRTTSIVTKQQKEHMQEEMHEQMSGYKRMRREHQAALVKLEEKCKVEMENHKTALDKEYDVILHNFTRELERLSVSI